jgi:HAD superfamily hydrolase (TIGR01509 family)
MDGTLVDNMHFHHRAWKEFLLRQGIEISDAEFHQKNVGTIREVIPKFMPHVQHPDLIMELGMQKEAVYRELYGPYIQALPGLENFLQEVYDAGIPMALATAADAKNIDFTLEGLGIRHFFQAITGSEEVERGKPSPDVYLISAQKINADPGHCIAFEDTAPGIRAALSAGMKVIALETTHRQWELEALPVLRFMPDYQSIHLEALLKLNL